MCCDIINALTDSGISVRLVRVFEEMGESKRWGERQG